MRPPKELKGASLFFDGLHLKRCEGPFLEPEALCSKVRNNPKCEFGSATQNPWAIFALKWLSRAPECLPLAATLLRGKELFLFSLMPERHPVSFSAMLIFAMLSSSRDAGSQLCSVSNVVATASRSVPFRNHVAVISGPVQRGPVDRLGKREDCRTQCRWVWAILVNRRSLRLPSDFPAVLWQILPS